MSGPEAPLCFSTEIAEAPSGITRKPDVAIAPAMRDETLPLRQVTVTDIQAVTDLVFELCGWTPERREPWRVRGVRSTENGRDSSRRLDDPLNSFFAEDLERLSEAWAKNNVGVGLREYLRGEDSAGRIDVDRDKPALIANLTPTNLPPACWPAKFPLVTAQQFAVNASMGELSEAGLFSVNGPPGTGKTTLLKDIVAAIVVRRADALMEFVQAESAFRDRVSIEGYPFPVHRLDARLCGFGIVVASANNNAVENISKELPSFGAIRDDLAAEYFSVVADSVAAPPRASRRQSLCWGAIAAALGNKTNRSEFAGRFWFEPKPVNATDASIPPDPMRLRSFREVMNAGEHGALSWEEAREQYVEAKAAVEHEITACMSVLQAVQGLQVEVETEANAVVELNTCEAHMHRCQALVAKADDAVAEAEEHRIRVHARNVALSSLNAGRAEVRELQQQLQAAEAAILKCSLDSAKLAHAAAANELQAIYKDLEIHGQKKPGFWAEFFRFESSRRWNARDSELEETLRIARVQEKTASERLTEVEGFAQQVSTLRSRLASAERRAHQLEREAALAGVLPGDTEPSLVGACLDGDNRLARARIVAERTNAELRVADQRSRQLQDQVARARDRIAQLRAALDDANLGEGELRSFELAQLDRDSMHKVSPQTKSLFDARCALFVAAMDLHKAFIAASWRKLRPALSAFVELLLGNLTPGQVSEGVMQLWDAFFLVVPVVSSTFADLGLM